MTAADFPHPQSQPDRLRTVFQALEAAIRKHGRALDAFDATIQQARATVTREQQ